MNPIIAELRCEAHAAFTCGSFERTALLDRAADQIGKHAQYRQRIKRLIQDKVAEVHNGIGGTIGYTLNLNTEETEHLWSEIERE